MADHSIQALLVVNLQPARAKQARTRSTKTTSQPRSRGMRAFSSAPRKRDPQITCSLLFAESQEVFLVRFSTFFFCCMSKKERCSAASRPWHFREIVPEVAPRYAHSPQITCQTRRGRLNCYCTVIARRKVGDCCRRFLISPMRCATKRMACFSYNMELTGTSTHLRRVAIVSRERHKVVTWIYSTVVLCRTEEALIIYNTVGKSHFSKYSVPNGCFKASSIIRPSCSKAL